MKIGFFVEKAPNHYYDHCRDLISVLPGRIISYSSDILSAHKDAYISSDISTIQKDLWGTLDAVVYPGDVRLGLNCKSIFSNHGTSDKKYQLGLPLKEYDLVLLAGQRDWDRLKQRNQIGSNCKITGYMKFDRLKDTTRNKLNVFDNQNKTIVYAPTWDTNFREMLQVIKTLSEIAITKRHNLIIKPHPGMLTLIQQSSNIDSLIILNRLVSNHDNIKLVTDYRILEYLEISDLLVTGVSSVTYESLVFAIPIIFTNAQSLFPNFNDITSTTYAWQCGYVCNDFDNLDWLIEDSFNKPERFSERRKELFEYSFYRPTDGKSCLRAKHEIEEMLCEQ